MTGTALCICGGRSERFPDSDRPCVCYGKARNSACTCTVNPGGQDGLLYDQNCPVHARPAATHGGTDVEKPIVTTLCGSTRFPDAFEIAAAHLGMMGRVVFSVAMYGHSDQPRGAKFLCSDGDESTPEKQGLDQLHFRKIDLSDGVFVVNVGGYVGSSTRREIAYAKAHDKTVEWMFPDAIPAELEAAA